MIYVTATLNGVTQPINGQGEHIGGSISQEVGAINSFSFDIYPTNKGFDLIQSRKTIIRATNTLTGRVEFAGRVLLAEQKMSSSGLVSKTVTCESFLGYLYDSIQPYKAEALYTLNEFIDLVLSNHNAQTEADKHIFRGSVDVEVADTGNIYKGLQYQTTFETLKSKLVDVYGGELEIVETDGKLYLNYLQQIGTTRATVIELGRNMQEASREVSPIDIVTRVIPLGAKLKTTVTDADGNETEQETEERLTLEGYTTPEGVTLSDPWIDDEEKIEGLGVICGVLDCSDITEQSNLYKRAKEYMTEENRVNLSHTLTALDLKEIGQEIDGLNCGDSYPVKNKLIGLDETLRITKKTIDINAPHKGSITIGEKKTTLSKIQASETDKINVQLQQLAGVIQSIGNVAGSVSSQFATFTTNLSQTINTIISEAAASYVTASDLEAIKEEISTNITQTAEDITIAFNNSITSVTEELSGAISSEFTELNAYIRYYMTADGQPVIELGASDSDIICKIINDKIAFVQNGVEIAYISDNQLYITNATILTQLNIGNFAFVPRANGNLSFVKVK